MKRAFVSTVSVSFGSPECPTHCSAAVPAVHLQNLLISPQTETADALCKDPSFPPLATATLLSVSANLTALGTPCKWSRMVFIFSGLAYLT